MKKFSLFLALLFCACTPMSSANNPLGFWNLGMSCSDYEAEEMSRGSSAFGPESGYQGAYLGEFIGRVWTISPDCDDSNVLKRIRFYKSFVTFEEAAEWASHTSIYLQQYYKPRQSNPNSESFSKGVSWESEYGFVFTHISDKSIDIGLPWSFGMVFSSQ